MTLRQWGRSVLDKVVSGEAQPAFQRVFLAILLISSLILVPNVVVNANSEILQATTLGLLGLLAWRWISWTRNGNPRYLDLVIEWALIIVFSVTVGDSFSTLGVIYTAFYFRPLVGTARWSLAGAVGSVVALAIGTHYSGHATITATSPELVSQIPLFAVTTGVGFALAHIVRRDEQVSKELRSAEQRYRSLVEQLPQVVYTGAPDGTITYLSPQLEDILGRSPHEIVGNSWEVVMPDVHPDDRERIAMDVMQSLSAGSPFVADMRFQLEHRGTVWARMTSIPVFDTSNQVEFWLGTLSDVTTQKQLEAKLSYQAFHDDLTGLPNRALFYDRLEHAIARSVRQQRGFAVLFLDLDNFKVVNDSLGHKLGDELIRAIGDRLCSATRASDTVARLGGDEFIVLLEEIDDEAAAVAVAEKVFEHLSPTLALDGQSLHVKASIGVVWSEPPHDTPDELIRYADLAMYAAKHNGKARYAVYRPEMNDDAIERLKVETELRQALVDDDLVVHYQPVLDLESGSVREVEALVRWDHPARGLLSPDAFLGIAEETGLIQEIDRQVLRQACHQVREWQLFYPEYADLTASVNLSPSRLRSPHLADEVAQILEEIGLRPEHLKLEITEHAMVVDIDGVHRTLDALSALGVRLAIDDFGTGNSALNYLREFPIDTLKIDRSFITGLGSKGPNRDCAMVRSLIALAKSIGLTVTAEGIEGDEYKELNTFGCDMGQGYRFARPMAAADLDGLLAGGGTTFDDGSLDYILPLPRVALGSGQCAAGS